MAVGRNLGGIHAPSGGILVSQKQEFHKAAAVGIYTRRSRMQGIDSGIPKFYVSRLELLSGKNENSTTL